MKTVTAALLATKVLLLAGTLTLAADKAGVSGTDVKYETHIECALGPQPVTLVLTGTALRKKVFLKVYAIGSYVAEGVQVRSAENLSAADCLKQLHLVMERDISGKEMAEGVRSGIRLNRPEPAFGTELAALDKVMEPLSLSKGDHVVLTHLPRRGLHADVVGKKQFLIENAEFSQAIWEIFLGRKNMGESIKKGLVSRL